MTLTQYPVRKFLLKTIDAAVHKMPDGWREDLLAHGYVKGRYLFMKEEDVADLDFKYSGRRVPRHLIDQQKQHHPHAKRGTFSSGLGDSMKKGIKWAGFRPSKGCGCHRSQARWNMMVPYTSGIARILNTVGL